MVVVVQVAAPPLVAVLVRVADIHHLAVDIRRMAVDIRRMAAVVPRRRMAEVIRRRMVAVIRRRRVPRRMAAVLPLPR